MRDTKSAGLFRYFEEHDYMVSNPYNGIYYVECPVLFHTQLIVAKELEPSSHIWLRALSRRMEKQDITKMLESINCLTQKSDQELADSVLEVSVHANKQVIEELIGDDGMSQTLMEIMEPQFLLQENEALQKELQEGLRKGIQ